MNTSGRKKSATSWRSSSRPRATAARRSTTRCCSARRAWARPRWPTSSRARWASTCARRPGRCSSARRPGRHPHQPRSERRAVHRRDPPPLAGGRGNPLSGAGRLPDRHHDRRRPGGAVRQAGPAAVHAGRRHDARRHADQSAARPLRHRRPPGVLQHRGITKIVTRSAALLKANIAPDGAVEIARRARGTPRIANRLLRRVRDYAEVKANGDITKAVADAALVMLDVDTVGFDVMDRKLLEAVLYKFGGGPVGIGNLAAAIGEAADTIEDVLEPYLIQQGFLQRTPRGRIATPAAYRHFGVTPPRINPNGELWDS